MDDYVAAGRFVELAAALETELLRAGGGYRQAPDPLEEAAIRHELGRWQWQLARFDAAERNLHAALDLRERLLGADDPRTIDTVARVAALRHYQLRHDADPLFGRVIAAREARGDEAAIAVAWRNYGAYLRDRGDVRARAALEKALRLFQRTTEREHPEHVAALKAYAYWALSRAPGMWADGPRLAERAWRAATACHGRYHPFTTSALLLVGHAARIRRDLAGAARAYEDAERLLAGVYGDAHPLVAIAILHRGDVAAATDVGEAVALWERGEAVYARTYPAGDAVATRRLQIAEGHLALGEPEVALAWARRALEIEPSQAELEWLNELAERAFEQGADAVARALIALARVHAP